MTDEKKTSRAQMAAIAALMGLMIYGPKIDVAKLSPNKEDMTAVTEELGKFILAIVDSPTNGEPQF